MSYTIALNFEDGVSRFINCGPSETIADAAYRQGVNVPIDCRDGACGTCKCFAENGKYEMGDYIDDALSEAEAAEGYVLTCQMRPKSDCVVLVPASSAVCNTKQVTYTIRIREVRPLSDSTFSLVLEGDALNKLGFLPGQYANLQVPGQAQHRAYSFSSSVQDGTVSFLIRNVPGGLMSGFLAGQAAAGAEMQLAGPLGSFYLREIRRPILMLAGGTGLAPFLAMLDKIVASGGSPHPIHLIYGVNTDRDKVEIDRLEAFAAQIPHFTFAVCVVDPESVEPRKGYVTQHIEPSQLNDGDVDIYLCGPPPMVEAVASFLKARSVPSASFHYEKFAPSN